MATAELDVDRHQQLAQQGLVSQRELELTIQSAIASKADLQGAQANLSAAEQGMKALSFGREQVSAEVLPRLLDAEAARDASIGEAARAADQVADVSLRLSNANQRRVAGRILSPIDGTVVKMAQAGAGETVRPGDKLVKISPTSMDKAIEMVADGIDAPLLNVGRKVKILFYGIPAIPLPAWPEMMAGTYNGVIKVVDQVDDGKGNFRFWSFLTWKNVRGLLKNMSARAPKPWDGSFSTVSRSGMSCGADLTSFHRTTRNGPRV